MPVRPLALAALAGLCACAPRPELPAGPQVSSLALFEPARMADAWHVVAETGPACGPLAETWTPEAAGRFRVTGTACGPAGARSFLDTATVSGPGRFTRSGPAGTRPLWVLWADADNRIVVVGAPDRSYARILARKPSPSPDLLAAAREILDFNGYDPGSLHPL